MNVMETSIHLAVPTGSPVFKCPYQHMLSSPAEFVEANFGCDAEVRLEQGQSISKGLFICDSGPTKTPTSCSIHNPDGVPARYLDDSSKFHTVDHVIILNDVLRNDPGPQVRSFPLVLGTWLCTCENADGKIKSTIEVGPCLIAPVIDRGNSMATVAHPTSGNQTFKIGGFARVLVGYFFTIECTLLRGRPQPGITWAKDDTVLPEYTNLTSLTIFVNASDPTAGDFMCMAKSPAGNDTAISEMRLGEEIFAVPRIIVASGTHVYSNSSEDMIVVVVGNSVDVDRGSKVIINCSLLEPGIPVATITWSLLGKVLTAGAIPQGNLLNIDTNLVKNNSGLFYCCQARNTADAATACSELNIYGNYCGLVCPKSEILNRTICECQSESEDSPVEEDQHATTAVTVSTTVVFSFILVIGLVGVPVLIKCHSCTKKHKREKNHKMSRKLSLPSRAIYQGLEEVFILAANDTGWQLSHDDLELQGSLGMGQFGDVKLAFLKSTSCTDRIRSYIDRMKGAGESLSICRTVAVKFLRGTTTAESKILFLQEINLMKKVSSVGSRHVIQLIGCIVSETPMAMVMEYVPFGDLHGNLIKWREELGAHSTYIKPLSGSTSDLPSAVLDKDQQYVQEALKEDDLFSFAHQIAIGMSYLASMNVIHRDLACRNVLVGENKILKVSDFGLSKEVDGIYTSTSKTKLPLQWMSPEAISHRLFSEKSDVWSYGVCLWEICTLGAVPFGHKSNAEVAASVAKSVFLERPRTCHDQIYKLMLECWKMNAGDRPTFIDIENYFEDLIVNKCSNLYITVYDIPEAHDIEDAPNLDPVQQTEEA